MSPKKASARRRRSPKARLLLYTLAAGLALALLGAVTVLGAYLYFAPNLPDADTLKDVRLQVPLRVYTRDGKLIAEYGEQRRVPLRLEEIPLDLKHAVLAAEDDRFYSHPGIDPVGMLRAAYQNVMAGEIVGGASTITQQVARNFFLSFDQTWTRKIREIFLSIKIEQELTKDEILELYMNKIYLGNRAYGFGAAAEIYYGQPLDQLTLAQLAMLATLPKAPSRYNPLANPERALQRRDYVLGRMLELAYIDRAEYEKAMAAPVSAAYHGSVTEVEASYVGELARADLVARVGAEEAYTGGYRVYTTVDSRLQEAANRALRDALQEYDQRYRYRGPVRHLDAAMLADVLADEDAMRELLDDVPLAGYLKAALVVELTDTAAILAAYRSDRIELGMPGLEWTSAETPADVLEVGDVVYVRREADGHWRLAQLPEVQGALVSLDPQDGSVLALVGGYDFFLSKYNRATQAQRQPGSSFKPFIYSAALANGFTPATIVNDAPVVFADDELEDVWRPENDSGRFYGPTRLREALVRSRNLVSIRVLQTMGVATAVNYIDKTFGLDRERLPRDLSLALGSAAFSPLEMATAYAVLANGGFSVEPYFVARIVGPDGETLFEADPAVACLECEARRLAGQATEPDATPLPADASSEAAESRESPVAQSGDDSVEVLPLAEQGSAATDAGTDDAGGLIERAEPRLAERTQSAQVNYLISDMMRDVIQRGTGVRARVLGRDDIAGKTGTTDEYRDAWFSGFNPEVVTTVWVGYDNFTTLGRGEYGGRAALPAWIDYMREALAGTEEVYHDRPPGLVTVRIDPETGLLAGAGQPDAIFETFIEGSVPAGQQNAATPGEDGDSEDDSSADDLF